MRCDETSATDNTCCIRGPETGLCATYTGITVNSTAEYYTLPGHCIMTKDKRTCQASLLWSRETPTVSDGNENYIPNHCVVDYLHYPVASEQEKWSASNIAVMAVGLVLFVAGVVVSVLVVVSLSPRCTNCCGRPFNIFCFCLY